MNKREISSINTKNKIIESGKKLFNTLGIQNVSVDEIVKDAKVAKGSFYVYFKNKEDLVSTISWARFKELALSIKTSIFLPIVERLNLYTIEFMSYIVDTGITVCRNWIASVLDPKVTNTLETKVDFDITNLCDILNEAIKKNELKEDTPIKDISYSINSYLYGLMLIWCMSDNKYNPKDYVKENIKDYIIKTLDDYLV